MLDVWKEGRRRCCWWRQRRRHRLTLFAKTTLILAAEVICNALVWIVAAIIFTRPAFDKNGVMGLALISWTIGLRHGLDADHISAIDNATRRIVSAPIQHSDGSKTRQRPVTVGLFFSLGHSTIVVSTIIAIAISAKVVSKLDVYGDKGGIIGSAVSGSFLILIGCINSVILAQTWRRMRTARSRDSTPGEEGEQAGTNARFNGILTRLAMPLLRAVDRPWKLYPIGVLFGLGFDTASSIALLSVAVIARSNVGGDGDETSSSVVLLAFLFTAGMTLVDSIDSCLMIWAYAPDPLSKDRRRRFALWEDTSCEDVDATVLPRHHISDDGEACVESANPQDKSIARVEDEADKEATEGGAGDVQEERRSGADSFDSTATRLSQILTLLSILIAFSIGGIELLGLIGDQCMPCAEAADRQQDSKSGGLSGRWWLVWRQANDKLGYIGIAIVALFVIVILVYYIARRCSSLLRSSRKK